MPLPIPLSYIGLHLPAEKLPFQLHTHLCFRCFLNRLHRLVVFLGGGGGQRLLVLWGVFGCCVLHGYDGCVQVMRSAGGQSGRRVLCPSLQDHQPLCREQIPRVRGAQSSFKLQLFLCSKGYAMDNLDEAQCIHLL